MLRRTFLLADWTMLDLWRMHVEQMKRAKAQEELDRKNAAAMRLRELREALRNLIRVINEDGAAVVDPAITDARVTKRYRDALKRALNSLK